MSDPSVALFEMLIGHRRGQTVHASVKIGIIDVLADGRRSDGVVAEARDLDSDTAHRLV